MLLIPRFGLLCLATLISLLTITNANIRYLRTVAFSAQRTFDVPASLSDEMIRSYGNVIRRDDNHFNANKGEFTAPLKGVYAFAFNFHQDFRASGSTTDTTYIKLVKESLDDGTKTDVVVAEGPPAPVDSPISTPGASVLLELEKGDKMFLATADDVDAATSRPIAFSGYLLTRL